jgi:hypothetical protein
VSYQVLSVLGRGGTSVVELALDSNGCLVATKRVAVTGSAAQMHVARQRLRREAEVLRRLAHPGILPILDVLDDGADLLLVFPAMLESLEDRVDRLGPLPAPEVARIGRTLLAAVATAHRHGVVHRDIKPANVLFDHAGRPALSDFGVAATRETTAGLTPPGATVGTPLWMAPEQARGEPAGPASDVFSLAATLRFAATGEGPYLQGPAAAVIARAARGEVRSVPAFRGRGLPATIQRMLDPRPERRPSAAAVLGGVDGTIVSPVSPDSPVSPATRGARRSRRRLAAGAVVAVVAAMAVLGAATALVASRPGRHAAPPAPHMAGKVCAPGWYNLNSLAADGCESRSDYLAGTVLTAGVPVFANLVPVSARDSFSTHVSGDAFALCWGSLHLTLTAPAHTAEELTVWKGTRQVASAVSADNSPATATIDKPSCFGADSEDLRVTVSVLAATGAASAGDFTLTRDGGW